MERTQVLELMGPLKLYGMHSAYDDLMGNGLKRQHEPPRIVVAVGNCREASTFHSIPTQHCQITSC